MTVPLSKRVNKLTAIEYDPRVYNAIKDIFAMHKNILMHNEDILKFDLSRLDKKGERIVVYGNIPYNITTPIIEKMIAHKDKIRSVYLVIQEEYADRLIADPGSKTYGSISCFVQYHFDIKKEFKIKKNCFYPVPKIDSSFISLKVPEKPKYNVKDEELLFKIIRKSFSQRRKKILNSLSSGDFLNKSKSEWETILIKSKISPNDRAEDVSLETYTNLANNS